MDQPPIEPQQQYVAYPRPGLDAYGTPEQLWALWQGYSGLNYVFLLNILLSLASRLLPTLVQGPEILFVWGGYALTVGLIIGFATYPQNKKIAYGANWAPGMAILASALMGLNSALCCGIIGYVVVQQLAANEMRKYGLKARFFGGIKKKDVEMAVAQLRQRGWPPPPQV